jgi:hypothetical protein
MDRARILLKQKYRLVHVPREEKARAWEEAVRAQLSGGADADAAGRAAARQLFPYEFRGHAAPESEIETEAILRSFRG